MSTAPPADQLRLLDIQELDTRLAQLAHKRRTHPTRETIAELGARAEDLERARTQAEVTLGDARRELLKAETDVEQVRSRTQRGQEKLNSGQASAKELQNITAELQALERRMGVLEDAQLEHMETVEEAENAMAAIVGQLDAINAQIAQVKGEQEEAFRILDGEAETISASRGRLTEGISPTLLALYEQVRAQTGGLGAVALHGQSTRGVQIPLSLTEIAAIKAAPSEQVIQSEEYDYILVRVED